MSPLLDFYAHMIDRVANGRGWLADLDTHGLHERKPDQNFIRHLTRERFDQVEGRFGGELRNKIAQGAIADRIFHSIRSWFGTHNIAIDINVEFLPQRLFRLGDAVKAIDAEVGDKYAFNHLQSPIAP